MNSPIYDRCDCYVSREPADVRFVLRRGAHEATCPVYRPSGDPVDARADLEIRRQLMTRKPVTVKRIDLFGNVRDTFQTERELNGFRESQGRMI